MTTVTFIHASVSCTGISLLTFVCLFLHRNISNSKPLELDCFDETIKNVFRSICKASESTVYVLRGSFTEHIQDCGGFEKKNIQYCENVRTVLERYCIQYTGVIFCRWFLADVCLIVIETQPNAVLIERNVSGFVCYKKELLSWMWWFLNDVF